MCTAILYILQCLCVTRQPWIHHQVMSLALRCSTAEWVDMTTSVDIIEAVVLHVDYTKIHGWKRKLFVHARASTLLHSSVRT